MLIMVDEPKPPRRPPRLCDGGWVAAPAVGRVIERMAPLLGIEPIADDDLGGRQQRVSRDGEARRTEPEARAASEDRGHRRARSIDGCWTEPERRERHGETSTSAVLTADSRQVRARLAVRRAAGHTRRRPRLHRRRDRARRRGRSLVRGTTRRCTDLVAARADRPRRQSAPRGWRWHRRPFLRRAAARVAAVTGHQRQDLDRRSFTRQSVATPRAAAPPASARSASSPRPHDRGAALDHARSGRTARRFAELGARRHRPSGDGGLESHGLDQFRLDGVSVTAAAFTNLTRDHLDYHGDMEAYLAAKRRLFAELLAPAATAVLNADVPEFADLACAVRERRPSRCSPIGRAGAGHPPRERHRPAPSGQRARHRRAGPPARDRLMPLAGAVPGDERSGRSRPRASPAATTARHARSQRLAQADGRARPHRAGGAVHPERRPDLCRLCAHARRARDRSEGAAPALPAASWSWCSAAAATAIAASGRMMGEIAARLADRVIVTDDNPRSEDPASDPRRDPDGRQPGAREIGDRARGDPTRRSPSSAAGDVLVIAGKGHEHGPDRRRAGAALRRCRRGARAAVAAALRRGDGGKRMSAPCCGPPTRRRPRPAVTRPAPGPPRRLDRQPHRATGRPVRGLDRAPISTATTSSPRHSPPAPPPRWCIARPVAWPPTHRCLSSPTRWRRWSALGRRARERSAARFVARHRQRRQDRNQGSAAPRPRRTGGGSTASERQPQQPLGRAADASPACRATPPTASSSSA